MAFSREKSCATILLALMLPCKLSAQSKPDEKLSFKLHGAYYREDNGKLSAPCDTNSVPAEKKMGYTEKFAVRELGSGLFQVQHWDAVCSDMLFPPEDYSLEELLKVFSFSNGGLSLVSKNALKPEAVFKWQLKDP